MSHRWSTDWPKEQNKPVLFFFPISWYLFAPSLSVRRSICCPHSLPPSVSPNLPFLSPDFFVSVRCSTCTSPNMRAEACFGSGTQSSLCRRLLLKQLYFFPLICVCVFCVPVAARFVCVFLISASGRALCLFVFAVVLHRRSVYPRVLIGLGLAQLTLAGYVFVREGYTQASLMLPLPVLIYWYGFRSYKR